MKELRIKGAELRAIDSEELKIEGYINAVGRESELLFSPTKGKWFKEIMEPGVFKRALENNTDIPMLLEHDYSKEIARTSKGTLELTEDSIGLKFKAKIDNPDLYSSIKNGEINSCSFGFVCEGEEIEFVNNREEKRYVKDIQLLEVSLVKNPAYIGSLVEARNMESALKELNIDGKEKNSMNGKKEENRAYCSYIYDTQDAINCCLELMGCATSLLMYKDNNNMEVKKLSRDILSVIGSYMVELTSNIEERKSEKEPENKKEENKETNNSIVEKENSSEKNNSNNDTEETPNESVLDSEKDSELTDPTNLEMENNSDNEIKEEEKEPLNEDSEDKKDEDEERECKKSSKRSKLSPEDEVLLIRAKISNLK